MKYKGFTYTPAPKTSWDNLSMQEKSDMMKVAVRNGITDLKTIREKYNEFAEGGSLYAGTSTDNDLVDWIIKEEGFTAKPTDIGDGKMTLGSGLTSQKWHNLYKKRGNKWSETDNRSAVAQEVADRRRWAEKNIPNWDTLPESSQKALLAYKYNYDFNAANSPKLFKALRDSNLHEAARQMNATSKDPRFQKGLMNRRKREQAWFLSDVGMPDIDPSSAPIIAQPVSTSVYNPYPVKVQNTTVAPRMVPDKDSYVKAHQLTEREIHQQKLQERWDAINRFNTLMDMLNIQNNPLKQFTSNNPIFSGIEGLIHADGGKIHIKKENRGKFTRLKERTGHSATWFKEHGTPAQKKMAVFELNARHWKHELGGNLFENGGNENSMNYEHRGTIFDDDLKNQGITHVAELPEIVVAGKKPERRQLPAVLREQIEASMREAYVEPNDNAWADTPLTYKKKNPHLSRKSEEGAKQHAAWEKEHPNLTAWGNVAGAVPFVVASVPLGAGIVAGGDALAATTAGQAVTAGLAPQYQAATSATIADAPALAWADAGLTSTFGAHGLQQAVEDGGISPMSVLEIAPLGRGVRSLSQEAAPAAKTMYDNGTLWDTYTTFRGRLGNYGDNVFTNMYGTAARRFGLPDKARVPADGIRKIREAPRMTNGMVDFTGNKNWYGNPHVNATIDRGVVSHPDGGWNGADTYLFPFRDFLAETKGSLKSIEPSDVFSNGATFMETPSKVTLISGDVNALENAQKVGMQTLSSPRLRRLYSEAEIKYNGNRLLTTHPKKEQYWKEYSDEVQRIQSQRGVPTLKDFRLLEQTTGLKTGIAPLSEYDNAVRSLTEMQKTMYKPGGIRAIMNGEVTPYIYPNGREVEWVIKGVADELNAIQRAKYNNVFYDPTTYTESIWRSGKEPKW